MINLRLTAQEAPQYFIILNFILILIFQEQMLVTKKVRSLSDLSVNSIPTINLDVIIKINRRYSLVSSIPPTLLNREIF
jgi:hypothetical protein